MIYDLIITAITERNFLFLLAPAVGIALGCVTGARLIGWLLKRYSRKPTALFWDLSPEAE